MLKRLFAGACLAALLTAPLGASAADPAYKVVGHIAGPDGGWDYVNVDSAAGKVYVAKGNQIVVADVKAGGPATALETPANRSHAAVPISGGRLLVTNGGGNNATVVDAKTGAVQQTYPTGANPDAAVYDAANSMAYAVAHSGGDVTFIDLKAGKVTGTVMVGGTLEFAALDGKGNLYVNVEDKSEIAVIDLKTKTVVKRYALEGCRGPTGLAYVPPSGLLVVACNGVASVIRADTGALVANLKIGPGADAVFYDATRKLVFVPSGAGEGSLAVIAATDPKAVSVVQTVVTQRGARTGAVDPATGRIYLPTAQSAAGGGRGANAPGTFELLVVGP